MNVSYNTDQVAAQTLNAKPATNFLIYENSTYGITMQYPSNWT